MEETDRTQNKGKLDEFDPLIVPRGTIFGGDGDIARPPIVVGLKVIDSRVYGDVLAEKFRDARSGSDGSVG
jgi:hypothetical protein